MYTVFPRPYDIRNAEKWVESWNVATKWNSLWNEIWQSLDNTSKVGLDA